MSKIVWKFSFCSLHFQWWFKFLEKKFICLKKLIRRGLDQVKAKMFFSQAFLDKIFGTKQRNPVTLHRTRYVWHLLLRVFWLLLSVFDFWKGDWVLGYVSTKVWDFLNISLFPQVVSLKLFGNSSGNSYSKYAILDSMFRFTCG